MGPEESSKGGTRPEKAKGVLMTKKWAKPNSSSELKLAPKPCDKQDACVVNRFTDSGFLVMLKYI